MKKLDNKGFSLAEILAVMAILIILMGLGISASTRAIFDSQKTAYLAEVTVQQKAIRRFIESEDIDVEDENTVYYFNYRLAVDDSESPFDEWEDCYVVVTYNKDSGKNTYYWTGLDKEKWGIKLHKEVGEMTKEDIVHNGLNNITPGKSVGGRDNVIIYDVSDDEDEAYSEEERIASNEMSVEEAEKCFDFKRLDDGTYEITNYEKKCGAAVDVPSLIDGKIVSIIGENAFRNKGISMITFYYGIKELKNGAVQENKSLKEIRIASTVKKVGDYAFYNCGLETVIFPEGLEEIGDYSFAYNSISKAYFSKTLKKIGYRAFLNNKLEEVEFNSAVNVTGGAFSNNQLSEEAGFIYAVNSDGTPNYKKLIGYGGESKNVKIPGEKNGVQLTTIGSSCFSDALIETVEIPEGVKVIESSAFYNNKLKSVKFPSTLTHIKASAFRANYLSEINLPAGIQQIGNGAFINNCVPINSPQSFIYNVSDQSIIVSGASGRSKGCPSAASGKLIIPATSPNGTKLRKIVSSAFIGGSYTGIQFPDLAATNKLNIERNLIYHNSPGNSLSVNDSFIYKIENGNYDYSTIISYMGKRPPKDGILTIPATKNGVALTTITASLSWISAKEIIIPETVTTIGPGAIFSKTNNANPGLVKIVNKTNKEFDWYALTGSNHPNPGKFKTGVVQHQSGNIEITSS